MGLVEMETLKTYIKNNLVDGFIRSSNSFARAPIFFDKKSDRSLGLYIKYQSFNNLTIKNPYFLPLLRELLD